MKQNRSPFDGLQFYGIGRIDGDTRVLTMSLHDLEGKRLPDYGLSSAIKLGAQNTNTRLFLRG